MGFWSIAGLRRSLGGQAQAVDFHQRVDHASVAGTMTIHHNYSGSPSGARPARPLDASVMRLDHGPQVQAIRDRLKALRTGAKAPAPLLAVLPGTDRDGHHTLVSRFGVHDLNGGMHAGESCQPLHCLPWPDGAGSADAVLATVGEALARPEAEDRGEMMRWLEHELPHSLCFGHGLDSGTWERDKALVRDWVALVSEHWPHPPGRQVVVAFLVVTLPADAGERAASPLARYVETLREQSARNARIVVTPDPKPVTLKELREWVGIAKRACPDLGVQAELDCLPDKLFPGSQELRAFMDVYRDLVDCLKIMQSPTASVQRT